jgi:citrate synthase
MEEFKMTKAEMKKEFKERWNKLFPNKRLLAVQLNGFTHSIYYDEKSPRAKVVKGECKKLEYTGCMSQAEARSYGMNEENVIKFFEGYPNWQYQNNAIEIVYVMP